VLRFNEAVETAYHFYQEHPSETLIIVTADHETGGITLGSNGTSTIYWDELVKAYEGGAVPATREEKRNLNDKVCIGWTTDNHTGAPVPLYAIGKGAEKFAGRMDNTDIKGKILN
jgi:alkaline phosphatase